MSKANFSIEFSQSSKELLAGAIAAIHSAKGTFEGDAKSGRFKIPVGIGDIEGQYTVAGSVMNIEITKKPLLVSAGMIEKKIKSYITPPEA